MLKLATLISNPGEPPIDSQYADPQHLASLGYTGRVFYETTALSGIENPEVIGSSEMRRWVAGQFEHIAAEIDRAREAGLAVYLFYDVLTLPRDLVDRSGAASLTCRNRPPTLCPASEQALDLCVAGLAAQLQRWSGIDGIVLRFGDSDAGRFPFLVGNDLYAPHCPRCSQLGRAERILNVVNRLHELVVQRHGKRLIVRAWNVRPNGMHDSTDLAKRVIGKLPGKPADDRLVLSFKFTQTDFWRYQPWNACSLLAGRRPVLYELQCQREFEGKGGVPNWQPPLWRDGCPESRDASQVDGLAEASKKVNLAGLWAWVRGGGWGGPFVTNEAWIDANVFAVPRLADAPDADVQALGREWIAKRLGVSDGAVAEKLLKILNDSPEFVREAFYIGPYARRKKDGWHPNADWIQDDVVDADAAWRMIQQLSDEQLDEVVAEKQSAAQRVGQLRAELQQLVHDREHGDFEPLVHSLMYAESLFEALRDLLAGLVAFRRYRKQRHADATALAQTARQKLLAAQTHWNHHTQRTGSLPGTATPFRESNFWDLTEQILSELTQPA